MCINTFGSSFDTVAAAYTGVSVDALSQLVSNDDTGSGPQSQILFPGTVGITYSIGVDGYNGDEGDLVINYFTYQPLQAAITILKVMSGMNPPEAANLCELDGDDRLGQAEVISYLGMAAE